MTRPNVPHSDHTRPDSTDRWYSRWLIPLVPAALGMVILVAAATSGHIRSGAAAFAILVSVGAISRVAGRFGAAGRGTHDHRAVINARAMSIVGTVLVIAITGCAAFTLARGESTSPYTALLAVGGTSYVIASLALRNRNR